MLLALDIDTSDHVVFAVAWILRYPLRYIRSAGRSRRRRFRRQVLAVFVAFTRGPRDHESRELIRADAEASDTELRKKFLITRPESEQIFLHSGDEGGAPFV